MSDPAKTPEEIEDVLASVRRLVSDHSPTATPTAPTKPVVAEKANAPEPMILTEVASERAPSEAPVLAEALVLTPSFRVTDPEDPWVPVTVTSEEDTVLDLAAEDLVAEMVTADAASQGEEPVVADVSPKDAADWQPDDRMASFDSVGDDNTDEDDAPTEADGGDDPSDAPSDEDIADLIRMDGTQATAADFESETGDDNWPEGGAEAALLTLVARRDPAPAPKEAHFDEERPDEDVDDAAQASEDVSDADLPEDEATGMAPDKADALDEVAAEMPEDEIALSEDMLVEEELSGDEPNAPPIFARQREDDAVDDADEASVEDLGDTESPFTFPETDEGILDEDTLREIIVDVVREELQGVLGQRITRNVRKMVRREIRLALAAEDLE